MGQDERGGMSKTRLSVILAIVVTCAFGSNKRHVGSIRKQLVVDVLEPSYPHVSKSSARSFPIIDDNNHVTRSSNKTNITEDAASINHFTDLPPKKFYFQQRFVRFLHMGKAGGGTVATRLRTVWNLHLPQCHPFPCIEKNWREADTTGGKPYMLLSLRDPVDRFVSAFYWRIMRICHPEVEKRSKVEMQNMNQQLCLSDANRHQPNETHVLFYRYNSNASLLGEALCSINGTTARFAKESLASILHAQYGIRDWLDFYWNASLIFPLVVEPGAEDLEDQVDHSMYWLYNESQYQGAPGFTRRAAYAQSRKQPTHNQHSASTAKQQLTPAAERCLEQFYRPDYQLLRDIMESACKTNGCRQAIQSILDRRKRAFVDLSPGKRINDMAVDDTRSHLWYGTMR